MMGAGRALSRRTMSEGSDETVVLLQRWHGGEREALGTLLDRHLPRLHSFASAKLRGDFARLRSQQDSLDLVQGSAAKVLAYVPRFVPRDGEQFFGLLCTFVLNDLRNRLRSPGLRAEAPARPDFGDSVLDLCPGERSAELPPRAAEAAEERAWVRLALEFLAEPERRLVLARVLDETPWEALAAELGTTPDAARMRFHRLMPEVANLVRRLREGRVDELLGGPPAASQT